jgi:hypothetical protein
MTKALAGTVLNVLWPMHIDVCRQELMLALAGQARPDLVGQTAGGQWVAMEAKGRSNAFAGGPVWHDLGRLAQTSLLKVCDAPKGHLKERRNAAAPMPDKSLREIAGSKKCWSIISPC